MIFGNSSYADLKADLISLGTRIEPGVNEVIDKVLDELLDLQIPEFYHKPRASDEDSELYGLYQVRKLVYNYNIKIGMHNLLTAILIAQVAFLALGAVSIVPTAASFLLLLGARKILERNIEANPIKLVDNVLNFIKKIDRIYSYWFDEETANEKVHLGGRQYGVCFREFTPIQLIRDLNEAIRERVPYVGNTPTQNRY